MGVEAAQHKTAAVKEHQQRKRADAARRVDADLERAARPIDHALANVGDLGGRRHQHGARLILGTRHLNRQSVRRRDTGAFVE